MKINPYAIFSLLLFSYPSWAVDKVKLDCSYGHFRTSIVVDLTKKEVSVYGVQNSIYTMQERIEKTRTGLAHFKILHFDENIITWEVRYKSNDGSTSSFYTSTLNRVTGVIRDQYDGGMNPGECKKVEMPLF